MAELTEKSGKNGVTYNLKVNSAEIDVLYRLLRLTKQNEANTRLQIAHGLRDLIEEKYASTLDYATDEALSRDHFGMITFKELEI